jgi:predicted ATPase/DNA-binding SARP family transcriptional activator
MPVREDAAHVRLLGGFSVAAGDVVVDERAWGDRDAAKLVAAVALAPGQRLATAKLQALLWPDDEPRVQRAVAAARELLGDAAAVLDDTGGAVALRARVDVADFEAAAASAREGRDAAAYERAVNLYAGPLLPGHDAAWTDARRAALAELHTRLCIELADLHGSGAPARAALARALEADPQAQAAHRALMRLFARSGRRQRAIAQYQLLRRDLRARRPDAEPDRRTRELYQALLPAVPATSPPPPPPAARTPFVGRADEREEVARLLASARLVTLTGAGGVGKSRLALETAAGLAGLAPDGIWLVEIAREDDDAQVAEAAAVAVGVPLPAHRPAQEALVAHLAGRAVVIVLDGCEHAPEACARLAAALVGAGPRVHVLATSRGPLHCAGELTWLVPPLGEAPELFVERATAARPGFRASADDRALIATICDRLQGLPLAVEIAAARTAMLPLPRIAADLHLRLATISTRARADVMRTAIEWSYELLTGDEQVLLRRLSVFAGSASHDAVRHVCTGGTVERRRVGELLGRLVDRGLVVADGDGVRVLDPVRRFAAQQVSDAGVRGTLRVRHLEWAVRLAAEHDPMAGGERPPRALEPEIDDLRAALSFALKHDPQTALRLVAHLRRYWAARGRLAECRRRLDACLAATPAASPARVDVLLARAALALRSGDAAECLRRVRPAVRAYGLLGDDRAVGAALCRHALLEQAAGGDGEPSFSRALELARRARDRRLLAAVTHASALVPWSHGDAVGARLRVLAALDLLTAMGDDERPFVDGTTLGIGVLAPAPGERPRLAWEEHVLLFDRFAREPAIGYALNNLAWAARREGDLPGARAALDEALRRFRGRWDRAGEALTLTHLGRLAASAGDVDEGRFRLTKALALRQRIVDRRGVVTTSTALGRLAMATGDIGDGRRLLAEALARAEAVDDLPAMAGVQSEWAIAEEGLEELPRAARLYEDASELWRAQGLARHEAWTRLALGDVLLARGDDAGAGDARAASGALFKACGDEAGAALLRPRDGQRA